MSTAHVRPTTVNVLGEQKHPVFGIGLPDVWIRLRWTYAFVLGDAINKGRAVEALKPSARDGLAMLGIFGNAGNGPPRDLRLTPAVQPLHVPRGVHRFRVAQFFGDTSENGDWTFPGTQFFLDATENGDWTFPATLMQPHPSAYGARLDTALDFRASLCSQD
jgi:hypothetical protein